MLAGAALVPSAPLLLKEVTPHLPDDAATLRAAARGAVTALPASDVAVLVAAGPVDGVAALHRSARADLRGLGRPDVAADLPVPVRAARAVAPLGLPESRGTLATDLAVLALLTGRAALPVTVAAGADAGALADLGARLVAALADAGLRVVMVVGGDGTASLGDRSPRPGVDGAAAWQDAYERGIGDAVALAALGPQEAARVHARGWAAAVVLAGACAQAGLRLRTTASGAPRGVGYVVAEGRG